METKDPLPDKKPRPARRKSPAKLKREEATDKDDIEAPPIPKKDPELLKECAAELNSSKSENSEATKPPTKEKQKPIPKKRKNAHPKVIVPEPEGHAQLVEPQSPGIDNPFYDGIIPLNKPAPPLPARGNNKKLILEAQRSSVSAKPLPVPPERSGPPGNKKDANGPKPHTEKVGHSIYELARDVNADGELDNAVSIEETHTDEEDAELEANKENKLSKKLQQVNDQAVGSMIVDKYFFNFICTYKGKALEYIKEKCKMPSKDINGGNSREIEVKFVAKNPEDRQECERQFGEIYDEIKKDLVVEKIDLKHVREISDLQNDLEHMFRSLCSWKESERQMDVVCERKDLSDIRKCITKYGGLQMAPHSLVPEAKPKRLLNKTASVESPAAEHGHAKIENDAPSAPEQALSQRQDYPVGYDIGGAFKVFIYIGDITGLTCEAIVNSANGTLSHGSGVARAIADAAGPEFEKECNAYMKKNKEIPVGGVVRTSAGKLPYKMVLHTVGPRWPSKRGREKQKECIDDLRATFINVIEHAIKENVKSVAIPPISSGVFKVPIDEVAECLYLALLNAADPGTTRPKSKLKQIHIVDIRDSVLNLLVPKFGDGKVVRATSGKNIALTPIDREDIVSALPPQPKVRGEKQPIPESPTGKKLKRKKSFFGGLCGGKSNQRAKYN